MLFFINEIKCSNSVFIFIMVIMTSPIDENLCSSALTKKNNDDIPIPRYLWTIYTTFYISICISKVRIFHQNYQS